VTVIGGGRVVVGDEVWDPAWVRVEGDRVSGVGAGAAPGRVDVDLGDRLVVPGFVDMHVHGGGGAGFPTGNADEAARAVAFHRSHGTTTMLASLVTAASPDLERHVRVLTDLVDDGLLAGLHLEGPWLSPVRRGAHDAALLRAPDSAEVSRLLSVGRGCVRMITLAPELDGARRAIGQIVDAGAVAAVGHTDATYELARAAVDAGATVATHLFNAMRPLHHREPGPVVALGERPEVTVELIADGLHVHPALLRAVMVALGHGRVALVTDAMAAAGVGDGEYRLGGLEVRVRGGVARLAGGDTIAGSTLTMGVAFRRAVRECGATLPEAVRMASSTPARAIGLTDVGELSPGRRADLVVLDADLAVAAVMSAGAWVGPASLDR
jgi:N-acetylglucosamine-6-phosphate deacetylase